MADSNPSQIIEAGLPNITGTISVVGSAEGAGWTANTWGNGCFSNNIIKKGVQAIASCITNSRTDTCNQKFDASYSNAIYGSSDTVTPLTYTVRAYICYA